MPVYMERHSNAAGRSISIFSQNVVGKGMQMEARNNTKTEWQAN